VSIPIYPSRPPIAIEAPPPGDFAAALRAMGVDSPV
jgi:hypothetical protein